MSKMQIKSVGVLSAAKMYAALGLIMGLLMGVIYFIIALFASLMAGGGSRQSPGTGGTGFVYGLIYLIASPIVSAIGGFICGAVGSFIYNLLAGLIGGVEIEVENTY
jgi:hypothetical protein